MAPFMHNLSMPETIGSVYGKYPRMIAALASIYFSTAALTIQIKIMSMTIGICGNTNNHRWITLLATLILIFYSTFGSIRAVTFTDVLQFLTFTVIIPLLAIFIVLGA